MFIIGLALCPLSLSAVPFAASLDQSVPCPRELSSVGTGFGALTPVHANASAALARVYLTLPALLEATRAVLHAPSASMIAVSNGAAVWESYAGTKYANGTGGAPTRDTAYRIASLTKVFTSTMMYQLRDRGLLPNGLDTAVAELMPGWVEPKARGDEFSTRGITLRSLAMQSSGLPRETPSGSTEAEILTMIGALPLVHPRFSGTSYSNLGLALLGRTLEKVAIAHGLASSWEDWVEAQIMAPLNMTRSGVFYPNSKRDWFAEGVDPVSGEVQPLPCAPNCTEWGAPCGSAFSTAHDMATWVAFLLNQPSPWDEWGRAEAAKVLDPSSVREMRGEAFLQPDGISAVGGATFEMAFANGRWSANKLGCDDGYRSDLTLYPSLGFGMWGAAASTCDLYGDGDAVVFPAAHRLVPPLEAVLTARAIALAQKTPPPVDIARISGNWCRRDNMTIVLDASPPSGSGLLRLEHGPSGYPFAMRWLDPTPNGELRFRILMAGGSETKTEAKAVVEDAPQPPSTASGWPGWLATDGDAACTQPSIAPGNLCPISCFREMARGDAAELVFEEKGGVVARAGGGGVIEEMAMHGLGIVCYRASPSGGEREVGATY